MRSHKICFHGELTIIIFQLWSNTWLRTRLGKGSDRRRLAISKHKHRNRGGGGGVRPTPKQSGCVFVFAYAKQSREEKKTSFLWCDPCLAICSFPSVIHIQDKYRTGSGQYRRLISDSVFAYYKILVFSLFYGWAWKTFFFNLGVPFRMRK